jgi:hypothetical protein
MGKRKEMIRHVRLQICFLGNIHDLFLDHLLKAEAFGHGKSDGEDRDNVEQGIVGQDSSRFLTIVRDESSTCEKKNAESPHEKRFDSRQVL